MTRVHDQDTSYTPDPNFYIYGVLGVPPLILRGDTNPPLVVLAARVGTPKV